MVAMKLSGLGIWSAQLRHGDPGECREAAGELEELGFRALWVPDVGGPLFEDLERLLASTRDTVVATGILNLWLRSPAETAEKHAAFARAHNDRFLAGIGVSHAPLIDAVIEPGRYRKPLTAMSAFLDELDAAQPPLPAARRVLAALGPKMVQTARTRAAGVHPYLTPPEHTRQVREALGDGPLVLPEQTVILTEDRERAHEIGKSWLRPYLGLPNYARNLLRLGFTEADLAGPSDRVFDALIAWGDEETVLRRVAEHRDAGADHVCVQVLTEDTDALPREEWRRLAAASKE